MRASLAPTPPPPVRLVSATPPPPPPALFSLVASFVIFPLQDLHPGLTIMMYADDLIIFLDG